MKLPAYDRWKRFVPWLLLAVLVLSLLPMLILGFYAWPAADDFTFPRPGHLAYIHGENVLAAALRTVGEYYTGWQGSFSAMTVMTLAPNVWSEGLYWLTPVVMLCALLAGTFKLCDTLVRKGLGYTWRETVCLAVPMSLLCIQLVPSPLDSFYWWNGASYYTLTYGIMLLYIERLATLFLTKKTWSAAVPGVLAAVFVGGSNYVSALLSVLVTGCFLLYSLWRRRDRVLWTLALLAPLCGAFLISILSPGNAVRQATVSSMPPLLAVWLSILQAGRDCLGSFSSLPGLLAAAAMVPFLWRLTGKAKFSFPWPAAVSVFTFLLFAAQNAPHFYAVSTAGPPRLRNIVFFSFWWLLLGNLWYWLGWVRRVWTEGRPPARAMLPWMAVCLVLLCVSLPFQSAKPTTAECVSELADGSAAAFRAEEEHRLELIRSAEGPLVTVPPLKTRPRAIFQSDITYDPNDWTNLSMALFYEKQAIILGE